MEGVGESNQQETVAWRHGWCCGASVVVVDGVGFGVSCPLTPDPSPPLGAKRVCCVFYGYESTRREGEAPAEPQVV